MHVDRHSKTVLTSKENEIGVAGFDIEKWVNMNQVRIKRRHLVLSVIRARYLIAGCMPTCVPFNIVHRSLEACRPE